MKFKTGFTLAEIMIALVTLGILAAIAIPAVTKIKPDNKKVMLKKAYSTLEKSVNDLINDDTYYPYEADNGTATYWGNSTDTPSIRVWKGFNYNTTTGMGIPASTDKFCYLLANSMNTIGTITCPSSGAASFTTSDGILWSMTTNSTANTEFPLNATSYFAITVDVNGAQNPNCSAATGTTCTSGDVPDRYVLSVRYDGKLKVDDATAALLTNPTVNH